MVFLSLDDPHRGERLDNGNVALPIKQESNLETESCMRLSAATLTYQ